MPAPTAARLQSISHPCPCHGAGSGTLGMEPWGQQGLLEDTGCESFSCSHLLVLRSSPAANPPVVSRPGWEVSCHV